MNPKISGISRFRPHPVVGESLWQELLSYRYARFERVNEFTISDHHDNSAQTGFVLVPADPDAGKLRLNQRKVAVLGVAKEYLEEVKDEYALSKNSPNLSLRIAGGLYDHKSHLKAGILPAFSEFGELSEDGQEIQALAMRQPPRKTFMTLGSVVMGRSWIKHKEMLIPKGVELIEHDIPASELSYRYPGVPLI